MALAFTSLVSRPISSGSNRATVTSIALDNLYTTGGYVLTPQNLGLGRVGFGDAAISAVVAAGPANAFLDCSNPDAPKLKLLAATAEVAGNATLTGATVVVTAHGSL